MLINCLDSSCSWEFETSNRPVGDNKIKPVICYVAYTAKSRTTSSFWVQTFYSVPSSLPKLSALNEWKMRLTRGLIPRLSATAWTSQIWSARLQNVSKRGWEIQGALVSPFRAGDLSSVVWFHICGKIEQSLFRRHAKTMGFIDQCIY